MPNTYQVYIKSVTHEADGVLAYELKGLEGVVLPAFSPGAHIDVIAENIPLRSYSLLNDPSERNRYVIAVAKDPKSRGGSIMIHDRLRAGDRLQVSEPRNLFPLTEGEHRSVLIAGGIGITPLWCMAQYLNSKKMDWELHYFARSVNHAALIDAMQGHIIRDKVQLLLGYDVEATVAHIQEVLRGDDGSRHYYCCGPAGMIQAYSQQARAHFIPDSRVHFESFIPLQEAATSGGYEIVLAKTCKTLKIEQGKSILDALIENGVEVMHSCREGICGACEVRVLEGTPDHRDSILSEAEKQAGKTVFVCCSGSKTPRMVLDL